MEQTLTYPNMRLELRHHLTALAVSNDPVIGWAAVSHPGGDLDYAIHFLFDDTLLAKDAYRAIGVFLHNENEAKSIIDLVLRLDAVLISEGADLADKDAVNLPAWGNVAMTAQEDLKTLAD